MDVKNIINCFQTNGISYPPEFSTVEKDGCIKVYEGIYNKNLEKIDALVRYGSNNGFSNDLKNTITKLTKLTVKICQEKKAKKHEKYISESEKIYIEGEKCMKDKSVQFDMVAKVNLHIDKYISGMEVLISMDVAEDRKPVLVKGIDKCKELKKILADVMNNSTQSALDQAKSIILELQEWSVVVANKMHDDSDLIYLDKAIEVAKQWKDNREVVKTGMFVKNNKVEDISALDFYEDNLSMIGKSNVVLREIDIFKNNLAEYKEMAIGNGVEDLKEKLQAKKDEKAKFEAEKNELVVKFQNGEISKMDLYQECVDIDQQVNDIKEDIEDLKFEIENKKDSSRFTSKVVSILESLNNQVLEYKADPIYLALLGEELDFNKLTQVMRGAGTDADIEYVLGVQRILDRVKDRRRKMDVIFVEETARKLNARHEKHRKERQERLDAQIKERNDQMVENQAKADEYLANLLGNTQ